MKQKSRADMAVVWELPGLKTLAEASEYMSYLTEAEYRGLLLSFDLPADRTRGRVIICGDSNLVIRQIRGKSTVEIQICSCC